jgi:hypothetical protein
MDATLAPTLLPIFGACRPWRLRFPDTLCFESLTHKRCAHKSNPEEASCLPGTACCMGDPMWSPKFLFNGVGMHKGVKT